MTSSPFRRRLVANTISSGFANLWVLALGVVTLPILLQGLGPTEFGIWVLIQSFSAVTGWFSLADLGLGVASSRKIAGLAAVEDRLGLTRAVAASLALFALVATASAAVMAALGPALLPSLFGVPDDLLPDVRFALFVFAGQIFFELLGGGYRSALDGLLRVDLGRLVDVSRRTVVLGAGALVASAGGGLPGVAVASTGAAALGALLGSAILHRQVGWRLVRPKPSDLVTLVREGGTVMALNATGVCHRTMDRLIVGVALGPQAVVLVEIATQVQNGVAALLSAASYSVTSASSWLKSRHDPPALKQLLLRGTRYAVLATVPAAVVLMLLAGPVVRVWIGPGYGEASFLIVLALLYLVTQAPLQVGSNLLQGLGRSGEVLRVAALALAVNLVASVALVRLIGVSGPFVGSLIGGAVLVPTLSRRAFGATGVDRARFVRSALLPALPAIAGAGVGAALVVALPLGDRLTIVAGTLAAAAVGGAALVGWGLTDEERATQRRLRDALRV